MQLSTVETQAHTLLQAYLAMRTEEPPPRQRDAAARLGVSEAELVASHCGGTATRLSGNWLELLGDLESLGTVMALTRNEHIVIEKDGVYGEIKGHPHVAMMRHGALDLRFFCSRWASAFACTEEGEKPKRSLQFFDESGRAVHKVHLREASNVTAFNTLVATHRHADQSPTLEVAPIAIEALQPDLSIDEESLRSEWDAMNEVHQFFGILKRHKVSRRQALTLAGIERARSVSGRALDTVLRHAAETGLDIMVFVGNAGCIEIHSGPVYRIVESRGWLNVLDAGFNLHAKASGVHEAWVVRKPSQGKLLRSLELYSADAENTAMLFVNREAGPDHIERWNALLDGLEA